MSEQASDDRAQEGIGEGIRDLMQWYRYLGCPYGDNGEGFVRWFWEPVEAEPDRQPPK